MLDVRPPRQLGIVLGSVVAALGLGLTAFGAWQVANAGISPLLVLWVALPLVGLPLAMWAGYQLYGLLTASYRLDRDGFQLRWGLHFEQAPLADIYKIERASDERLAAPFLPRLLGLLVGERRQDGKLWRFYATRPGQPLIIELPGRLLVVTPPDAHAFERAFVSATRLGSLHPHQRRSSNPDLLPARLWADRSARLLLVVGILIPLGLLGFLGLQAGRMPSVVPFGFDPEGAPAASAPAGRLLLLPLIGGLIWLADLLLGAWLYRSRPDRPLAYMLWGLAIIVGGLLAAASLLLIRSA